MQEMLQKIVPGTLPHYFVILTLANFAKENGQFDIFLACNIILIIDQLFVLIVEK